MVNEHLYTISDFLNEVTGIVKGSQCLSSKEKRKQSHQFSVFLFWLNWQSSAILGFACRLKFTKTMEFSNWFRYREWLQAPIYFFTEVLFHGVIKGIHVLIRTCKPYKPSWLTVERWQMNVLVQYLIERYFSGCIRNIKQWWYL